MRRDMSIRMLRHVIPCTKGYTSWAFSFHGDATYFVREALDLHGKLSMSYKKEHDLPRVIGTSGVLEPKFTTIIPGWYCVHGDVPSIERIITAFEKLIALGFFRMSLRFEPVETVHHTKAADVEILDALRNRKGLEDSVNLTGVLYTTGLN